MNEHSSAQGREAGLDGGGAERRRPVATRDSIPDLVKQVAEDVSTLLGKEISLARAELREAANDVKAGVSGMVAGFGLVVSGILFILLSAVLGLALFIPGWAAALIVGVVVLVIGMITVKAEQKKMRPAALAPDRTTESLHKDRNMARRVTS